MINQTKRLLSTLNPKLLAGFFVFCLAAAGAIGCSSSGGGSSKTQDYHLSGYDGIVSATSDVNNLQFYSEFPWFVNLTYQVFDAKRQGITNLTVNDFSVLEDGVEVSKDTSEMNIRKRDTLPPGYSYAIKTVLFLDNTPSSSVTLESMLQAGQVIVDNLDQKGQQQLALMAYDTTGEAQVVQNFTSSLTDLNKQMALTGGIAPSYGTTNFYGGVIKALSLWEDNHSSKNPAFQQGFLVAVTDGKDTTSLSNVASAVAARGNKQVIVVAVGNDIPDSILNDLKLLGNGGFYHVTNPNLPADPKVEAPEKENLCENMLAVQSQMMAYADGFYWLRYKTLITSQNANPTHPVVLSVLKNRNTGADSTLSGTFNSTVFFSGEPSIYFNTTASEPSGITEKVITIERGQGAGEVAATIQALTFLQSGYNPSQYEWTSGNNNVVTVASDPAASANATVTVVGPGDALLTVKDTVNNITKTLAIKVEVREESFEMMNHMITSKGPWFADATFQVRKTPSVNNQWEWTDDLAREDMTVMENGQKIDMEASELNLRKRDNIPSGYSYTLKTVLLIDNSPSARNAGNLQLIQQAAKAFAKRALVNDPADNSDLGPLLDANGKNQQQIAVVSYDENGNTILVQDFTANLATVNAAIDGIARGFGPIDFYGGMLDALHLWDNDQSPYDAANTAFVQGVVVVLSDGWQSNPGFYDKQAVLTERGDKQVICVSVGNDLLSSNSTDLVDFGNDGYYSVPNPGQAITVSVVPDSGQGATNVTYTALTKTLMGIQNTVYAYANSFYWLDYKSYLPPAPQCNKPESMVVTINNNSNTGTGKNVSGNFDSCHFFAGEEGKIYVNSTVTNPNGIKEGDIIPMKYVMLGTIPLGDPTYPLEAFTYKHANPPSYEWAIASPFVIVTPDPRSYANSRATLSLPANKQQGSTSLRIDDTGNSVFRTINVNVDKLQLNPIAYYPFNGNANDATGHGYNGEVFGATLTTDRHGKANSAYSFNGTSDHIALNMHYGTDSSALGSTVSEITVCAWVKTLRLDNYGERIICLSAEDYWSLMIAGGNVGWVSSMPGQRYSDVLTSLSVNYSNNQWHFICATYSYGLQKQSALYVDGVLIAKKSSPLGPIGTGLTNYGMIGTSAYDAQQYNGLPNDKTGYFKGQIDDVIILNLSLDEEQVYALWQAMK